MVSASSLAGSGEFAQVVAGKSPPTFPSEKLTSFLAQLSGKVVSEGWVSVENFHPIFPLLPYVLWING